MISTYLYIKEKEMPLIKGAKPGSKGFKQNIETEMKMGHKPQKQAVAIAYDVAKKGKKDHKGKNPKKREYAEGR
jgi:hypothetical protein